MMRLETIATLAILTTASAWSLPSPQSFIPLPTCLNLRTILEATSIPSITNTFLTEICATTTSPLPVTQESYTTLIRPFAEQVILTESANMGAPHLSGSYLTLLDYLFNLAHGECGLSQFEADGCAASAEELEAVGQCIRARGWQVAVANALSILPLFSLDACNRQVEFFGRDEVVGVLVPAYAREFAAGL